MLIRIHHENPDFHIEIVFLFLFVKPGSSFFHSCYASLNITSLHQKKFQLKKKLIKTIKRREMCFIKSVIILIKWSSDVKIPLVKQFIWMSKDFMLATRQNKPKEKETDQHLSKIVKKIFLIFYSSFVNYVWNRFSEKYVYDLESMWHTLPRFDKLYLLA